MISTKANVNGSRTKFWSKYFLNEGLKLLYYIGKPTYPDVVEEWAKFEDKKQLLPLLEHECITFVYEAL